MGTHFSISAAMKARVRVGVISDGGGDERLSWVLAARYHAQVGLDTSVVFDTGERLFVRALENAGNLDRTGWQRWHCQSVLP